MKKLKFPELRQAHDWDCGASAIQSVLAYYGIDVSEEVIIKLAKTNEEGTSPAEMKVALKKYGLDAKDGKMTIGDIKKYLDKGIPVILLVQAWTDKKI
jgi:ABC-type bacteriocin/lantibiotic exporter with double-glycine peptidase domain